MLSEPVTTPPAGQCGRSAPVKRLELKACDAEFWHHFHKPAFSRSLKERLSLSTTLYFILQSSSSGPQLKILCTAPRCLSVARLHRRAFSTRLLPATMTCEALWESILLVSNSASLWLLHLLHPSNQCLTVRRILGNAWREAPGASSHGALGEAGGCATNAG